MTGQPFSLRLRLVAIILLPLLALALAVGAWLLNSARVTAADLFDRSLLSAALAVSTDVAISGGDALSSRTRNILADSSGGRVFYHVYGPDGVITAGYATPPVGIPRNDGNVAEPTFFDATYLGRPVSGVRLQSQQQIDGFAGIFTTTVWQDTEVRAAFVRELVLRAFAAISGLVVALALIVWFGVRIGLRPLLELQDAIARRSGTELTPIQRPVPVEAQGIVDTLNKLFRQVSASMTAQSEFISNAAHQLRNPIAGVLALAEAVERAPDLKAAQTRSRDLFDAAREAADLSQKLMLLERAQAISPQSEQRSVDLDPLLEEWVATWAENTPEEITVKLSRGAPLRQVTCDPTMLREALGNLVDNAVRHGGPGLSRICISSASDPTWITLKVADDGRGLPADQIGKARARFQQLSDTSGSGLGLSIVDAVAAAHGGDVEIGASDGGLTVSIRLPR